MIRKLKQMSRSLSEGVHSPWYQYLCVICRYSTNYSFRVDYGVVGWLATPTVISN